MDAKTEEAIRQLGSAAGRERMSSESATKKWLLVFAIAIVASDQLLKALFGSPAAEQPADLDRASAPFLASSLVVQVGLGIAAYRTGWLQNRLGLFAALAVLCAGMSSNWIDRALRGRELVYLPWRNNPYNLGHVAVTCGAMLLIGLLIRWLVRRRPAT